MSSMLRDVYQYFFLKATFFLSLPCDHLCEIIGSPPFTNLPSPPQNRRSRPVREANRQAAEPLSLYLPPAFLEQKQKERACQGGQQTGSRAPLSLPPSRFPRTETEGAGLANRQTDRQSQRQGGTQRILGTRLGP
jgi:hypothetical protein